MYFIKRFVHAVLWYQVFLSYTNNFQTPIWSLYGTITFSLSIPRINDHEEGSPHFQEPQNSTDSMVVSLGYSYSITDLMSIFRKIFSKNLIFYSRKDVRMSLFLPQFGWVLWCIKHWRLYNAKSSYIYIYIYIYRIWSGLVSWQINQCRLFTIKSSSYLCIFCR